MPSADEIREDQRAVWDGLSAGWEKWDELITRQLEPISAAMIDSLQLIPRAHHLDIASRDCASRGWSQRAPSRSPTCRRRCSRSRRGARRLKASRT